MKEGANSGGLLQLRRDRRELGVQLGAYAVHDRDDGEPNASCDEAVFNRGGPGFVFEKRAELAHRLSVTVRRKNYVNTLNSIEVTRGQTGQRQKEAPARGVAPGPPCRPGLRHSPERYDCTDVHLGKLESGPEKMEHCIHQLKHAGATHRGHISFLYQR